MRLTIAKVDQVFFDGEAISLTAPGAGGELTVLGHHEPLITTLKSGALIVRAKELPGGEQHFPIDGGVLEVNTEGTTVIL